MPNSIVVPLPSDCSIQTVKALHASLSKALAEADTVLLDCAVIERADTTFVQTVLAAAATALRRGKRIDLENVPPLVEAAFRRAGAPLPRLAPS